MPADLFKSLLQLHDFMDAFLFADLVPEGTLPHDGPMNRRRPLVYLQSLWFNEDHERFPPCRFEDYLSLRGWNQGLLQTGRWRAAHPENVSKSDDDCVFDAIAIIQAWMTLGFLEDVFQDRTWLASYLHPLPDHMEEALSNVEMLRNEKLWQRLRRNSTGKALIFKSQTLASNLAAVSLVQSMGLHHAGRDSEYFARLPTLVEKYARAFNHLTGINDYDSKADQTSNPIDPDTESGAPFFFTLAFPKLIFEAVRFHLPRYKPDIDLDTMHLESLLVRSLRAQNGWCPHTIEKLYHTTCYTVFHWLWASDIHALDGREHSTCTTSRCSAMHVSSEAEYPEAHAEGCDGGCARSYPSSEQILKALASDRIPLIVAKPNISNPSRYTISVTSIDPGDTHPATPYVAFSHVWIDGLGSTTEHGIPSCQASYLARVAGSQSSSPDGSVAFWIDSLCVPAAPAARMKAIQFMSSTYKRAHTVIVIDDTLRKVRLYDSAGRICSPEHLLLRIYTSPWNQRVWTYQEGVLAQRLVFLLAEGHSVLLDFPLDLDGGPARGPLSIRLGRDMFHHVYSYLRAEVQALNGQVRPINIGTVALELRWRDTLHRNPDGRNDEVLATGTVLGLDMRKLLNAAEGPARMALFYQLLGRLYRNIIFTDVVRLQVDGFRWAPSTFLVQDERRPDTKLEVKSVHCTANGLVGKYITFAVAQGEPVPFDITKRVTVIDEQRCFDVTTHPRRTFTFTHIVIYPTTMPESIKGTIFIGVAVQEDTTYARELIAEEVDFVGNFQTVVYLSWFRERDTPVRLDKFPNGELLVQGTMREMTLLLR